TVPAGTTQTCAPSSGARCSAGRQQPTHGSQRASAVAPLSAGCCANAADAAREMISVSICIAPSTNRECETGRHSKAIQIDPVEADEIFVEMRVCPDITRVGVDGERTP